MNLPQSYSKTESNTFLVYEIERGVKYTIHKSV